MRGVNKEILEFDYRLWIAGSRIGRGRRNKNLGQMIKHNTTLTYWELDKFKDRGLR